MRFRPLHDRVVVKRIDAEEKTAGGIIIPDTAKEKPQQGEVVAVGPGGRDETGKLVPIDLKVGDRVLFGKWSGTEVKLDGIEYLIMKESDVKCWKNEPLKRRRPESTEHVNPSHPDKTSASSIGPGVSRIATDLSGEQQWLRRKSNSLPKPATRCCAASTSSTMR